MRRVFLAAASLSAVTGCGHLMRIGGQGPEGSSVMVSAKLTDRSVKLPRICLAGVAQFTPFDPITPGYREIARLTASGDMDAVNNTALYKELRWRAGFHGANAIIVSSVAEAGDVAQAVALVIGASADRQATATAIYIPADTQRVRLACPAKKSKK